MKFLSLGFALAVAFVASQMKDMRVSGAEPQQTIGPS